MKKALYNIEREYLEMAEQIELAEGELTPELETALAITEGELQTKAVGYGFIIREAEGNIAIIDAELKRLTALKKSEQSKVDRLKDSIDRAMKLFGIFKVETPTLKLSFRSSKRCVGQSLHPLPDELVTIVPEQRKPNLTAIKATIENGFEVDGYTIEEFQNLQIK